jgi:hypothetical protein
MTTSPFRVAIREHCDTLTPLIFQEWTRRFFLPFVTGIAKAFSLDCVAKEKRFKVAVWIVFVFAMKLERSFGVQIWI